MTQSIRVRCPGCQARLKAPSRLLGQTRDCPQCRRRLAIRPLAPDDAGPRLAVSGALALAPRSEQN
jgi:hypothetical protein